MNFLKEFNKLSHYNNKNILITGGTGTLGNKLVDFFLNNTQSDKICIFSRDEFKQWKMKKKFKENKNFFKLRFFIGDIRELKRLDRAFKGIDIVFHTAALKQVDTIEYNPMEAIKTNIMGTQNVIDACINNNVSQLIGVSTDKCVSPVNLYGATKLVLEKLIIAGYQLSSFKLKTCVLRYGNVMGSRGSVIHLFKKQSSQGFFTVTDEKMTRFNITLDEACKFIINCVCISGGGEIFVPKLEKYSLKQLCTIINSNNKIKKIEIREGEKLHEKMISKDENNIWESKDFYIITTTRHERYKLKKSLIDEFNLSKVEKRFDYTSELADNISNEKLLKIIKEINLKE
tara:strand:- start:361 stop:1392 length:1032 start_codon:yes stop_codon:yes gene_type:complete